jgi:uncharacterized membrane protein
LKGLGVILSIMVALCGMIQLYLMNINSTPPLLWSWNVLAIIGFLMGILHYKIFDASKEDKTKRTLFLGFILFLNIMLLVMIFSFPISDMESVLGSGFVLTMTNFEEPTWFLLFTHGERTEVNTTKS